MAVIKTRLTDSYMNENAIGTDLTKLVRNGVNTEALYNYAYNRIIKHIVANNELLFDYEDVENALKGYSDKDNIKRPDAYKYFTPKYKKLYRVDTDIFTENIAYTDIRKDLFREAQAKMLFEILQGRLSKETALEDISLTSKEIDSILFDQLYLYFKPNVLRSI